MTKSFNPFASLRQTSENPVSELYYRFGSPKTIKANCKDGEFLKLAQVEGGVKELHNLTLLNVVYVDDVVMYPTANNNSEPTGYAEIFFADSTGKVCATLIKTQSFGNLYEYGESILRESEKTKTFYDYKFSMKMSVRKGISKYFAVEFERGTELTAVEKQRNKRFFQENVLFCQRNMKEYLLQRFNKPLTNENLVRALMRLEVIPSDLNFLNDSHFSTKIAELPMLPEAFDSDYDELNKDLVPI